MSDPVGSAIDSVLKNLPKEGEIQDTSRAAAAVRESQEPPITTFEQYFNRVFPDDPTTAAEVEPPAPVEEPQHLNAIGRLAQHSWNVLNVPLMPAEERARISAEMQQNRAEAAGRLTERASNFFQGMGKFASALGRDPSATVSGILSGGGSAVKEFARGIVDDPLGSLNGLANSIVVDPIMDAEVAMTGIKFDDPTGVRAASPEEYEHAALNTIANGAAVVTAGVGELGIRSALLGQRKLLGTGITAAEDLLGLEALPKGVPRHIPTQALAQAGKPGFFVKNPFITNSIANISSGYASGMAYGMVQGAGSDDQANQMLASGLMFASFGTAASLLHGGVGVLLPSKNVPLEISEMAGRLANYRQYKQTVTELLPKTIERVQVLADSPSLNMAIFRATKSNEMSLIRGVTPEELDVIQREANTQPFTVTENQTVVINRATKVGEKGVPTEHDVLVIGRDAPDQLLFPEQLEDFKYYGFMRDQLVSYGGENYRVRSFPREINAVNVELQRMNNPKVIKVPLSEISDVPLKDSFSMGMDNHKLNYSLKAQILAEMYTPGLRGAGQSRTAGDIWKQNHKLLLDPETVTGKPLSMVLFRQERGTHIAGTGKHYAADINGAMVFQPGRQGETVTQPKRTNTTLRVHQVDFKNPYIVNGGHRALVEELINKWIGDNVEIKNVQGMTHPEPSNASTPYLWNDRFGKQAAALGLDAVDVTFADGTTNRYLSNTLRENISYGAGEKQLPKEYKQLLATSEVTARAPGEAGYQLQDKLIRKILTDMGHDGVVYNKLKMPAGTTWNEFVEIADFSTEARRDVGASINTIQFPEPRRNAVTSRLYDEFRDTILGKKEVDAKAHKLEPAEIARLDALEKKQNTVTGKDPQTGRDIFDVLTDEEARDMVRLRAKRDPLPEAPRGQYTELDRIREKVAQLRQIHKSGSALGRVDVELNIYEKYLADLESGKAENSIIREGKKGVAELGPVLGSGKSFHQSVVDFATEKGMEAEVEALKQEFAKRFATELFASMDGPDSGVFKRVIQEYGRELEKKTLDQRITLHKVVDHAQRAGVYFDHTEGGNIILRSVNDNKRIAQVKNLAEAKELVTKMGTEKGIEFDGGDGNGPVPPYVMGGEMATPQGPLPPNMVPYQQPPVNKLQELMARVVPKAFTTNNKLFLDHDLIYQGKTRFYNDVFRVVQQGYDGFTFAMRKAEPMLLKIQAQARKFDAERRAQIGEAIESMSPDEVVNLYFRNRQLTPIEIELGTWLSDNKVDLREVYDFRAARREATEGMPKSSVEYQNEILRLKLEAGLHDNPILAQAIERVDNLKGDKGAALRLARSKMARDGLGEFSRSEYMAENKFGDSEKQLVNDIDAAYDNLAITLKIPEGKRLGHYMTHIRLYEEGFFTPSTVREFGPGFGSVDTDFYARMARTGEVDVYERDPVVALVRYVRAGTKADHLMPALDQAIKNAEGMLKELPNDGRKVSARESLVRFFNDVRGVTPKFDRVVNEVLERYLNKHLGLRVDAQRIANAVGLIGETAAQGLKPLAGVRDFVGNLSVIFTEFGTSKARKFLQYGMEGTEVRGVWQNQKTLIESGIVPERGTLVLENPVERNAQFDPSWAVRNANRAADVGLAVSMQPKAYRFAHTGAYLTFLKDSDAALSKLNKKLLSKEAAYREVGIDKFEAPIQQEYDRLVSANKFDEASVYIAKIAQEQLIGKFGQSNGLHYSGNLAGRIFGQFGTWTAFTARNIGRMITTGSVAGRAGKIARASVVMYGLSKVSDETGLNLGNWHVFPGASFFDDNAPLIPVGPNLSPLVESGQTVMNALTGRGMRKSEAMRKLRQTLPIDPKTGEVVVPHLYIPFSYQTDALIDAYHNLKVGKMGQAIYRGLGGQRPVKQPGGFGGF